MRSRVADAGSGVLRCAFCSEIVPKNTSWFQWHSCTNSRCTGATASSAICCAWLSRRLGVMAWERLLRLFLSTTAATHTKNAIARKDEISRLHRTATTFRTESINVKQRQWARQRERERESHMRWRQRKGGVNWWKTAGREWKQKR